MSQVDYTAQLSTKYSQLAPLLIGPASLFTPKFWNKSNIHVTDETSIYTPIRDGTQFNGTVRFTQPKRATLTTEYLLEIVLSASVQIAGGPDLGSGAIGTGAYVNNLGDQLLQRVVHRYGSSVLHEYDGEYQQLWQRITTNEVDEEGRNALTLGALPLSVGGIPEFQRRTSLVDGVTVHVPLNRLWFSQHLDEAWMPEAFATEGEIEIQLQRLERVVYNALTATTPFVTPPTIESIRLRAREITLTVPEKMNRLSFYETDRGNLTHFLDVERQASVVLAAGTGGAGNIERRVRLDNIRLDMQQIIFVVRRGVSSPPVANEAAIDSDWSCDALQPPVYDFADPSAPVAITSALGARRIDAMYDDLVSFRLEVNGKRIADDQNELVERAWVRKLYHLNSQARSPVYQISFSMQPENTKVVTGFQNAANLGNLELVLTLPDTPVADRRIVDVWVHSHNVMQQRRGDVVKSLK